MIRLLSPAMMATAVMVSSAPALAQQAEDVTALRAEIRRLRAELERLETRLDKVAPESAAAQPATATAPITASAPASAPAPGSAQPSPPATPQLASSPAEAGMSWRGAPTFSNGKGLTFKPRGRLQFDTNIVSRPDGIGAQTLGWSSDARRAFLGADGTLGGGLGYRMEVDFADGGRFTDLWLTYDRGPLTITLGHHRLSDLEDLTSDLETSFLERAAFVSAFGFERRLGLSATYARGDIVYSAGIFADDLDTLGSGVTDNSYAFDTRLVYMPRLQGTQFHLGASFHHRELQDFANSLRYRARPGARTTDMRFVDTGLFSATGETGYGLEFAAIHGPVHVAGEAFWQTVARPALADPTFFGGYGEVGYVFAGGRTRGYSKGSFTAIKPVRGIDKGGAGAWQLNLRYDWLDLNGTGVNGGTQRTLGASLVWVPIEHVKFLANYLHVGIEDTPILAGPRDDYSTDVIGLRAQYDF